MSLQINQMTLDHIMDGLSAVVLRLANDHDPPAGWTPQQWAYVCGLASAQVLILRDRIASATDR